MKGVLCPVCNTRGVPFWNVFWMILPWSRTRCEACAVWLKFPKWPTVLFELITHIPNIIIILVMIIFASYWAIPLLALYWAGLVWLRLRVVTLTPIKGKNHQK